MTSTHAKHSCKGVNLTHKTDKKNEKAHAHIMFRDVSQQTSTAFDDIAPLFKQGPSF